MTKPIFLIPLSALLMTSFAYASPQFVRFTFEDTTNANLDSIIALINQKTGATFSNANFLKMEELDLGSGHFSMHFQVKDGIPLLGHSLRIWSKNGELIQAEAQIDPAELSNTKDNSSKMKIASALNALSSQWTMNIAKMEVAKHADDRMMKTVAWRDYWMKGCLVREVTVKAQHGKHIITIGVNTRSVIATRYVEYPQIDKSNDDSMSIPVRVFPVYEEPESKIGTILPRIKSELRYINAQTPQVTHDPYESLRTQHYYYAKYDPVLSRTAAGQEEGYWSMPMIKAKARELRNELPLMANGRDRIILDGKYATINLHPLVPTRFPGIHFTPAMSAQFMPGWVPAENDDYEMVPFTSLLGKPILSLEDAWNRPVRRLPDHDPASYINDGFDEIQVYWAINQLFESLGTMGFTDPELSTRPFNAFLYDPDVSMRDNAYYTDDTINFTTYSSGNQNYARDNSTIWHELGHGVMDRLMGDFLTMADTGGLSEGIADLVAQFVIMDVMWKKKFPGQDAFRIINHTGFNLTNEVHDDGESYGGVMNDMLMKAIKKDGKKGLRKFAAVVLEAMRLTRNHPALDANVWFNHMLFADQIMKTGLNSIIQSALAGRNYNMDGSPVASVKVMMNGTTELTNTSAGSRENPIKLKLAESDVAEYDMSVSLIDSATYKFDYPVTVKFSFNGGPLQGAIHWQGEESGDQTVVIQSATDMAKLKLAATGKCDAINQEDGSCKDFVYIKMFNKGEDKPRAKKRFYLRVYPQD